MALVTQVAQIPYPERADRVDGPASFAAMARRLDDITVTAYASAATRTAAYTAAARAPIEGTVSYLKDIDALQIYTGIAWVTAFVSEGPWTALTITSPWSHPSFGATAAYRVIGTRVDLRGTIQRTGGVIAGTILTLPTALWPPANVYPPLAQGTSVSLIALQINSATNSTPGILSVKSVSGSPDWVSFDGVSYSLV